MTSRLFWVGIVVAASIVACGGDDKSSSTSSGGSSSGGTASSSSGAPSSSGGSSGAATGGGDAGGTVTPKAKGPEITTVMKMTGSLHVNWELPDACDGVELERKDGESAEYAVKYKLPGTVDNKHDGTATEDVVYMYRARCKVGSEYTEYSNEMGKNPKR